MGGAFRAWGGREVRWGCRRGWRVRAGDEARGPRGHWTTS